MVSNRGPDRVGAQEGRGGLESAGRAVPANRDAVGRHTRESTSTIFRAHIDMNSAMAEVPVSSSLVARLQTSLSSFRFGQTPLKPT